MLSLYIHTSHDGSITCIQNRRILFHHQIDRFNKFKHSSIPDFLIFKKLLSYKKVFNKVVFTFFPKDHMTYAWQKYLYDFKLINKKTKIIYCTDKHHIFHASCAKMYYPYSDYYLVWDQEGAHVNNKIEQESLYDNNFNLVYSNHRTNNTNIGLGKRYSIATKLSNFNSFEEGKTMALAQYEKNKVAHFEQKRLEKKSIELFNVLKLMFFKKNTKVCLTGGVSQNVVNNSSLLKKFKDLQINVCPFNGDFGLSLGAAAYYEKLHNVYIPLTNIYTGIKTELDLKKFDEYKKKKVKYNEVCRILQKEPVAIFQSFSEQGQRGLGNRSLLIDALAPNAINKINEIKKREYFRPFACSILEEDAHKFFDTKGKISHYMMYTFKTKKPKLFKNVICPNKTSRIQTVARSSNFYFFNLLRNNKIHYKKPFLLNTSLNLPGHTLVETIEDMFYLFSNTKLKYVYFPELETIVYK